MKKVLGVALALALVGTSVFAQVSTSAQVRSQVDVLDIEILKGDKANTNKLLGQKVTDSTTLGFSVSSANAGVDIAFQFEDYVNDPNTVGNVRKLDTLAAWAKFGGFKLTGTIGNSRFTTRLLQSTDRTLDLTWLNPYNYGVALKNDEKAIIGKDGDNMARITGNGGNPYSWSTIADYTFDFDFAKFLVKATITQGATDFNNNLKSGFGFEGAFQMDNMSIDLVAKFPKAYKMSYGLYFQMQPINMLQFVVGGTLGYDGQPDSITSSGTVTALDSITALGFDARLRVVPLDPLALTLHANFSHAIAKLTAGGDDLKRTGFYALLNATYDVNDMFAFFVEGGYEVESAYDGDVMKFLDDNRGDLKAQLGFIINPFENVSLATSVKLGTNLGNKADGTEGAKTTIQVPFVFQVSF